MADIIRPDELPIDFVSRPAPAFRLALRPFDAALDGQAARGGLTCSEAPEG